MDWIKIYTSTKQYEISLLKAWLKENEIEAIEMNRQDSFYKIVGDFELFVQSQDVIKAKYLIEKMDGEQ